MTQTFETTIARIISQKSIFDSLDERAVEIGVVLPLLRQVGWNTENVLEIYPQRRLPDGSKVDYDLQIDGESRILIEVKGWGHPLNDENEKQLEGYCRSAKPELAVLTSGRSWRLYLPPTQRVELKRKKFLDFDITTVQPTETKETFTQFLARDSMVDFRSTVAAAKKLLQEIQGQEKLKETLTEAWNELANDKDQLAEVLLKLVERKGIQQSLDNVKRVLDEPHYGSLAKEVPTRVDFRKPSSFALPTKPDGKRKVTKQVKRNNGWYNFLIEVCELMQERHPESFLENILSVPGWFSEFEDSKFSIPIGEVGIYAKKGGSSGQIREASYDIVTRFGYPGNSLVIKDSRDETL